MFRKDFSKIDVFKKISKKCSIWGSFWEVETEKNPAKMVMESMLFFNVDFKTFFCRIFVILARFWEGPGPPKIRKNQKKSIFDRVQFRRRVLGGFWEGLGRILGGFGEDFGKVFWLDFEKNFLGGLGRADND